MTKPVQLTMNQYFSRMPEMCSGSSEEVKGRQIRHVLLLKKLLGQVPTATSLALFQNLMMDATEFGTTTSVLIGPDNTYKTPDDLEGACLNTETGARRQYPIGWVNREEVEAWK